MRVPNPDFRLDDWIVRTQRCCIERGSESIRIKPKSMAVLECLAAAAGEVVSRDRIFDEVWPDQAVTDDVLTHSIAELRKAFGDSARDSRVIETIPKKGFRLVAEVLPLVDAETPRWSMGTTTPIGWWAAGVVVLVLIGIAGFWPSERDPAPGPVTENSLAVLPFVDLSESQSQGYFADGLTEELINRLTRLQGLSVTGRTSSFYFKNRNEDLRDIGNQLSVQYILEGSVRKSSGGLRITAQLVDVDSGFHLWSKTFDRPFDDIFVIQEEIAESVARTLSISLSVGEIGTVPGNTRNIEAFDEYMLGGALLAEYTAESDLKALNHFRRATEIDPDFALAWFRLASTYRLLWLTLGEDDRETFDRLAGEAFARAEALVPDASYIIHEAAYRAADRRNWSEARRLFDKLQDSADSWRIGGFGADLNFLLWTGHVEQAMRAKSRFETYDPLHPDLATFLSHIHLLQGRIDDALAVIEGAMDLGGWQSPLSVEGLVAALASQRPDEIRFWLEQAAAHQLPGAKGVHDTMLELFDDPDRALAFLRRAFEDQSVPDYYIIVWASYYGDYELALGAMRRSPDLWAFWTPLTQPLRATAEFRQILVDIGLVDYFREYGWNDYCRPTGATAFVCD